MTAEDRALVMFLADHVPVGIGLLGVGEAVGVEWMVEAAANVVGLTDRVVGNAANVIRWPRLVHRRFH